MDVGATTSIVATRPGKSAQAVGHIAKATVAEAKAAGTELPRNAQGMAASAIAQGADPGAIFAALVAPPATAESTGTDTDATATDEPVAGQETMSAADAGYATTSDILGDSTLTEAQTALALFDTIA